MEALQWVLVGSENGVQFSESTLGPDDESADVSSGGKLEEVESADVNSLNTWDVSQGSDKRDILAAIDNKRSSSGSVSSVSELSKTSSNLDGVGNLLDISEGSDILEESDCLLSPFNGFGSVVNNEGEFGDLVDSVSSGLDEGENG